MKNLCVLFALLFALQLQAQNAEVSLQLRNGDIVSGKYNLGKLSLKTDYGTLSLPPEAISRIKFGVNTDKSVEKKVKDLINKFHLGDNNAKNEVYDDFMEIGIAAIPPLENYLASEEYGRIVEASSDSEVNDKVSLEEILDGLYGSSEEEKIAFQDEIWLTDGYQMGGKINIDDLKIEASYGTLKIPRNEILSIEVVSIASGSDEGKNRVFKLIASKHISGNKSGGWLKTGIQVTANQQINISASGSITLASLSNKTYYPNGKNSQGNADYDYGQKAGLLQYGQVVFKVGRNGKTQVAGSKYMGRANGTGELYISIYETVYNPENKGSYTIRISK